MLPEGGAKEAGEEATNGLFVLGDVAVCVFLVALLCVSGSWVEKAFLKAMGKAHKPCLHVDLKAELGKNGLGGLFSASSWPPTIAIRELATKLKTVRATGQPNIFVCADLNKCVSFVFGACLSACFLASVRFLPNFCPEHCAVVLDEDGARVFVLFCFVLVACMCCFI